MKKKSTLMQTTPGDKMMTFVVYFITILVALICFYPLYFTVIASISDPYAVYTGKISFLPVGFTIESYQEVMKNSQIWTGYGNTIFYTVVGTMFNLALTIPGAYALSKKQMFGRAFLMTIFIITMYFSGGMIPTYLLYKGMNLVNTRTILCIIGGVSVYNLIVTRTYFKNSISKELYEAARIDGANELHIFWSFALPLAGPIIAVMALYYAVGHWSSYFSAMIYVTKTSYQPLQLVLRRILILNENAFAEAMAADVSEEALQLALRRTYLATTMKYALVFIASAPMLVAYPFVQKFFVKGVMVGSLKG